ncbi:MFS transporter [Gordonia hydrophobica]|uniref:MFS transporter n=1 Tax=Gordonia hydrophobica TaxID=40516 RepID=A0ABZ2U7M6_9ACTN|nr:MFS transporter [Gordonia hydrophobica]MBM7368696.1 MFS family permease [Gordonia hydrophobica]
MKTFTNTGTHDGSPPAAAAAAGTTGTQVTKKQTRTAVASATIGTTIEWYDFFLYATAAGLVFNHLYFPQDNPALALILSYSTFFVAYIARPLGGILFGHLGDRIGRKKTLVATMYIMGVATFLIGAIPTYDQIGIWAPILLTVLRLAQGLAIGGEWGGAVLLSVEYAPKNRRGLFGSFPQMGLALGLFLGTGAFTLLSTLMSDGAFLSYGWRLAFFVSVLLVVVGVILRSKIAETPSFQAAQAGMAGLEQDIPLKELLSHRVSRRHLLLGMGTRYAEGVAYSVWAVFIIAYATSSLDFTQTEVLVSLMISALVLVVFVPFWGRVSDSIPRRVVYSAGTVAFAVFLYPAFWLLHTGSWVALTAVLVVALGIIYPMLYGPVAAFYSELFPPTTRYSGISIVYQLSGIISVGPTPVILTWLDGAFGVAVALGYVIVTCLVTLVSIWCIRAKDMDAIRDAENDLHVVD